MVSVGGAPSPPANCATTLAPAPPASSSVASEPLGAKSVTSPLVTTTEPVQLGASAGAPHNARVPLSATFTTPPVSSVEVQSTGGGGGNGPPGPGTSSTGRSGVKWTRPSSVP